MERRWISEVWEVREGSGSRVRNLALAMAWDLTQDRRCVLSRLALDVRPFHQIICLRFLPSLCPDPRRLPRRQTPWDRMSCFRRRIFSSSRSPSAHKGRAARAREAVARDGANVLGKEAVNTVDARMMPSRLQAHHPDAPRAALPFDLCHRAVILLVKLVA